MNQKERRAARGLQIVAVCCCFCLLAVGAGVTYRAMDREKAGGGETLQKEQPVTAVQSKTIEIAQAEQQGGSRENKGNKGSEGSKGNKSTACKEKRTACVCSAAGGRNEGGSGVQHRPCHL